MPERLPDFRPVLEALVRQNARYVLIGGLAMAARGSAHITGDIDLAYTRDRENITAIRIALQELHPRLRGFPENLPFVWDDQTLRSAANLTLETDVSPVDLLGDVPGIDSFQGLWERSALIELYGLPVRTASVEDLIAMKQAANREKDKAHILELLALQKLLQEQSRAER